MPQVYYQQISPGTQLVVWHVMEPETYFAAAAAGIRPIAHPHKRLQHLCGRYLLQLLVPTFPLGQIVAEHNNKPFLPCHPYHFSISHCDDYVAAMVSTQLRVGIDVETVSKKVAAIRHKFLTTAEEAVLADARLPFTKMEQLTLAWSTKETLFKWLGESGVDFKAHLVLQQISNTVGGEHLTAVLKRTTTQQVEVKYRLLNEIVLTWLAN